MSRRLLPWLTGILLACTFGPAAFARSSTVLTRSTKASGLYITHSLKPGHRYQLDVTSSGHRQVTATGFQFMSGVANHRAFTSTKPTSFKGVTPVRWTVTQALSAKINEWQLTEMLSLKNGHGLTVRLVDVGHSK